MDYILSLKNQKIKANYLSLRPLYYSRNQKVGLGDFTIIRCLGTGGFSRVYLVKGNFNNKYYALKLMEKKFIIDNSRESIVEN
jgi:serum/glucocorticoid-regulated kinase 2